MDTEQGNNIVKRWKEFDTHPDLAFDLISKHLDEADLCFVDSPDIFESLEMMEDTMLHCCESDTSSSLFDESDFKASKPRQSRSKDSVAEVVKSCTSKIKGSIQVSDDVCIKPELEELLKQVLNKLIQEGVPLHMIHDWFDTHIYLSRLTITRQFKIFLNDYGNIEITMGPLPKTVFLFYLRHPEGVDFSSLMDYRDELIDIYGHITTYEDSERIEGSIDRLIDPFDNSISEKCSAIRKAFTDKVDPSIARYYYVHGEQGSKKQIQLDRKMVEWKLEF